MPPSSWRCRTEHATNPLVRQRKPRGFPVRAAAAKPRRAMAAASYPALRLRRTRASAWSHALHRETVLTPADLIWPLFVTEGNGVDEPIASLPGVSRWSLDGI